MSLLGEVKRAGYLQALGSKTTSSSFLQAIDGDYVTLEFGQNMEGRIILHLTGLGGTNNQPITVFP